MVIVNTQKADYQSPHLTLRFPIQPWNRDRVFNYKQYRQNHEWITRYDMMKQ